jgi:hypothetical protein
MTRIINTVSAYRSLLQEDDNELKELGIKKLLSHISLHWIDIANDINLMYIAPHLDKLSTMTLPFPIGRSLPSFLPNSISTLMIMMRP